MVIRSGNEWKKKHKPHVKVWAHLKCREREKTYELCLWDTGNEAWVIEWINANYMENLIFFEGLMLTEKKRYILCCCWNFKCKNEFSQFRFSNFLIETIIKCKESKSNELVQKNEWKFGYQHHVFGATETRNVDVNWIEIVIKREYLCSVDHNSQFLFWFCTDSFTSVLHSSFCEWSIA